MSTTTWPPAAAIAAPARGDLQRLHDAARAALDFLDKLADPWQAPAAVVARAQLLRPKILSVLDDATALLFSTRERPATVDPDRLIADVQALLAFFRDTVAGRDSDPAPAPWKTLLEERAASLAGTLWTLGALKAAPPAPDAWAPDAPTA